MNFIIYIFILFSFIFSLCSNYAYANNFYKIIECRKIENRDERLKCYDSIEKSNIDNDLKNVNNTNWIVKEEFSKLDNTKKVIFINNSINKLPNQIGILETGSLIIRCDNKNTEVFITWPSYLGNEAINIEYKIGDGKITKSKWNNSVDGKAVFVDEPFGLINGLFDKDNLVIRLSPYGRNSEELEFNLNGINDLLGKIAEHCQFSE